MSDVKMILRNDNTTKVDTTPRSGPLSDGRQAEGRASWYCFTSIGTQ